MAPDGNPAVAYTDLVANPGGPPNSIYYSHNGSRELISNDVGDFMVDVAFAPDGSARILFPSGGATSLNMAKCADPSCVSTSVTVLAPPGYSDGFFSEAVDANGNPQIGVVISGYPSDSMYYIQCSSADCSTYTTDGVPGSWEDVSLVADSNGLPRILAQEFSNPGQINRIDHIHVQECPTSVTLNNKVPFSLADNSPPHYSGIGILSSMQVNPPTKSNGQNWNHTLIGESVQINNINTCPSSVPNLCIGHDTFTVGIDPQNGGRWLGLTSPAVDNIFYDWHVGASTKNWLSGSQSQCLQTCGQQYSCNGKPVSNFTIFYNLSQGTIQGTPVTNVGVTKQ